MYEVVLATSISGSGLKVETLNIFDIRKLIYVVTKTNEESMKIITN